MEKSCRSFESVWESECVWGSWGVVLCLRNHKKYQSDPLTIASTGIKTILQKKDYQSQKYVQVENRQISMIVQIIIDNQKR